MKTIIACLIAMVLLTGCIELQGDCPECQECETNNCAEEKAQLTDQRAFFQEEFEKQTDEYEDLEELAEDLWDDYYDCYIANVCWGDVTGCKRWLGEFTQEDLDYYVAACTVAKNYDEYYERFEDVDAAIE